MPNIRIEVEIGGYLEQVDEARNKQIPFATAVALTRTAQDGQAEVRRQERRLFKLRNTWTLDNTKITPATRSTLRAEVYTDTANQKSGAPDYLARQEEGGEKVPHAGGTYIAIPTKYLREHSPGPIPDAFRPRNLLPVGAVLRRKYTGRFDGPSIARRLSAKILRSVGGTSFSAFLRYDRGGTLCIFVHVASTRDIEPWYILVTDARVRAVLEMEPTIEKVVNDRFEVNWDDAWELAGS